MLIAEDVFKPAAIGAVEVDAMYGCPNSPGAKQRVEQKPSDELIINVKPSLDLVYSQ